LAQALNGIKQTDKKALVSFYEEREANGSYLAKTNRPFTKHYSLMMHNR